VAVSACTVTGRTSPSALLPFHISARRAERRLTLAAFPVPIEPVAQLREQIAVSVARTQLARLGGRPAIAIGRDGRPRGLLFGHRLLACDCPPQTQLGAIAAEAAVVVPCLRSRVSLAHLRDLACLVSHPAERYAIAIDDRGAAIGIIDLLTVPQCVDRDFSSGIERFAHEAATPLMGILSSATLLGDERLALLSDPQRDRLQAIHRSAKRLARELERLDLLARIQAGRATFYPEPIALATFCQEAIERAGGPPVRSARGGHTIEDGAIAIDRRYGAHLFAAAIEAVAGRFGAIETVRVAATLCGRDAIVVLHDRAAARDAVTNGARTESGNGVGNGVGNGAQDDETLEGLRTLVTAVGGDASLCRDPETGTTLSLLLPNVAESPDRDGPCDRALVWTQAGRDFTALQRPGWYVARVSSIADLLAKVDRLAPRRVFLDYGRDRDRQQIGDALDRLLRARDLEVAIVDAPDGCTDARRSRDCLHYPLVAAEVDRSLAARPTGEATIVSIDLRTEAADREEIAQRLRRHHCRTIEINALDRAALFAEIWQADVVFCLNDRDTRNAELPAQLERLADELAVPCIAFDLGGYCGQASRRDRSLVYWPDRRDADPTEPIGAVEMPEMPDAIAALQWLRSRDVPPRTGARPAFR